MMPREPNSREPNSLHRSYAAEAPRQTPRQLMHMAWTLARKAAIPETSSVAESAPGKDYHRAEVPVAAVIANHQGQVIAQAVNAVYGCHDPTAHAEVLAIRQACARLGQPRLDGATLVVTLEPCALCAAAISLARLQHLYFGAFDVKAGAVENGIRWFQQPACAHRCHVVGGIMEKECRALLTDFFARKRKGSPAS